MERVSFIRASAFAVAVATSVPAQGDCTASCPGDLDGDGIVDGADVGILLGVWQAGDPCADLDGSGVVDGADLGALLGDWGNCPGVPNCPSPEHDCSTRGGPGCSDVKCCTVICAMDPFCCEVAWDLICINLAHLSCRVGDPACPPSDHNCFTTGALGCTDIACCEMVCAIDPFCCQVKWDEICVDLAFKTCEIVPARVGP